METPTTETGRVSPGSNFPASRPGIRFVICVAAAVFGVIGVIIFK